MPDTGGGIEICLVRHGETEANTERRIQGWLGGHLTALGRRQAAAAGRELFRRHGGVKTVYSSDLDRTVETARLLARPLKAALVTRRCFREIKLGPWEGRLLSEVAASDGVAMARWRQDARRPMRRGIEPLEHLRDRLIKGLDRVAKTAISPIIITTHGGAISVILTQLLGMPLRTVSQMPVMNGSISRLYREGARTFVMSYNETGHLIRD
jgi:broad specificity phosphatase PhoE